VEDSRKLGGTFSLPKFLCQAVKEIFRQEKHQKIQRKKSTMLYGQKIFFGKMRPNGHIVRKKGKRALV
jgi:hypothetical protein